MQRRARSLKGQSDLGNIIDVRFVAFPWRDRNSYSKGVGQGEGECTPVQ